jgi:two-component system, OmpR family, response regulator VicR
MIVDDDRTVADVVSRYLVRDGLRVECLHDGEEALRRMDQELPDLVVLDLMLPGIDGLEVCRKMRARWPIPVVMLTALGEETDKVVGFETGADDYVSKPFSVRELLARVRAQLRREGVIGEPDDSEFVIGDVRVNLRTASVTRRNRHLELSPHEFELLRYLIAHRGEVVSREQLLRDVWGYSQLSVTRTVDNYIFRLRTHVEPRPHDPRFILTVHGSGYRLVV